MTTDDRDDAAVRRAISDLRGLDARDAPGFNALLARPRRQHGARLTVGRLAAGRVALAAMMLAAAVLGYRVAAARASRLTLPSEVAALSSWRPVTDVLLETSAPGLFLTRSPLSESIINVNTQGVLR